MTDSRNDTFWSAMANEMRRVLHLRPYTDEEAEREYDEAPEVPISEDQIAEYAGVTNSGVPREPSYEERTAGVDTNKQLDQEIGEVLGLYRNEGEMDPDVQEEMRRQREEALEDDEDEESNDAENSEKL